MTPCGCARVSTDDQDLAVQDTTLRAAGCRAIRSELKGRGVTLRATKQRVDTATAASTTFRDMLEAFAEFETDLRGARQMEGITAAKERGVSKGCKPRIDPEGERRLHAEERLSPSAIARRPGIARSSVHPFLRRASRTISS